MSCLHFVPIPLILLYHNRECTNNTNNPEKAMSVPALPPVSCAPTQQVAVSIPQNQPAPTETAVSPPVIERPKAANAATIANHIAATGKIRIYQEHIYWYANGWYHLLQTGELRRLMRALCTADIENTAASGFSRTSKSSCSAIPSCLLNHQATIRCSASRTVSMIWYRTPYHHIPCLLFHALSECIAAYSVPWYAAL